MEISSFIDKVILGDCLEVLKQLPDNSIDAVVTDPPYGLGFMGEEWDPPYPKNIAFQVDIWRECLRVLKPGGHLVAFGAGRTYHHLACAVEDAGFEIRDMLNWVYANGMPKSLDIAKAVKEIKPDYDVSEFEGWKTLLKPAHEPICLARKPISEATIAENVMKWKTGALNIEACRIDAQGDKTKFPVGYVGMTNLETQQVRKKDVNPYERFPSNLILDGSDEVKEMFPYQKSGERKSDYHIGDEEGYMKNHGIYGKYKAKSFEDVPKSEGSASRFFANCEYSEDDVLPPPIIYCPKAKRSEKGENNMHSTVKPVKLMRYLVRLVTPKGGVVLDPFAGSGTTGVACIKENFHFICIEKNEEYYKIAEQRLKIAENSRILRLFD